MGEVGKVIDVILYLGEAEGVVGRAVFTRFGWEGNMSIIVRGRGRSEDLWMV